MALMNILKDSWPGTTTGDQKKLAMEFGTNLLTCAKMAANKMGMGQFGDSGAHGMKAEERFFIDNPKSHRFYRASVGSTVERAVYTYVVQGYNATELEKNLYQALGGFVFALEYTKSNAHLSYSFSSSRPDIRLSLGTGTDGQLYEAIFDMTSEKQQGHVLGKGDNWVAKARVPLICEIVWTDDDIMHK